MAKKNCKCLTEGQKWLVSLYAALVFLLIASPFMYRLTGQVTERLGLETSNDGCPNLIGLVMHAVVFLLLMRLLMLIPHKDN